MSENKVEILDKILSSYVLPLYYNDDYQKCYENIVACYAAGVRIFELTNRGQFALSHFQNLKKDLAHSCPDLYLGVGTIYSVEQAKVFYESGASFIIQPVCIPEVGAFCKTNNLVWIPGAMTLNEIYHAHTAGADIVKIFPGNILGPDYIKTIRGPLPNVKFSISGGVEPSASSVKMWLSCGGNLCGLGSSLFVKSPYEITECLRSILDEVKK